jgi:hypothetical protein
MFSSSRALGTLRDLLDRGSPADHVVRSIPSWRGSAGDRGGGRSAGAAAGDAEVVRRGLAEDDGVDGDRDDGRALGGVAAEGDRTA